MPSCQKEIQQKVKPFIDPIEINTDKDLQGLLFNVNRHSSHFFISLKKRKNVKENKDFMTD